MIGYFITGLVIGTWLGFLLCALLIAGDDR